MYTSEILLNNLNILTNREEFKKEIFVKIRSTGKLIKSRINIQPKLTEVELLEDEFGISPGQACVFYKKDENGYKLLGGGWIKK